MDANHSEPTLTIIVPTRDEEENIFPLLNRIHEVMQELIYEVVFVDDSDDHTAQVIRAAQQQFMMSIKLIERSPVHRKNGLSGAVVEGLRSAGSSWVCVMDADLQHPPELIPELLSKAQQASADIVIASRLVVRDGRQKLGRWRAVISFLLAYLTRILFSLHLRSVSDPLSGLFLLRRDVIDIDRIHSSGFKILLEILVRHPRLCIAEIPLKLHSRYAGNSKADLRVGVQFLKQLLKLYLEEYPHFPAFLAVGLSGLLVNHAALAFFTEVLQIHYLLSAIISTQISTLWNFVLIETWVYVDRPETQPAWHRAWRYFLMNNTFLLLRGPLLSLLISAIGIHYLVSNLITIVIMTLTRYLIADRWIWSGVEAAFQGFPFLYNIHGIIRVESAAPLPELEYFQTHTLESPDIRLKIGRLPENGRRNGLLIYEENLKNAGFGIAIQKASRIDITATPLLGKSPHVLYTNVVEPVLRWTFARKGYALVHGACISSDGSATIITARTDTGKTTTTLKAISKYDCGFLSDDMLILAPSGQVLSYPKPLTISRHTLQAIDRATLSFRERLALFVQSRIHSRSGRRFGMILAELGLPAATLNAVLQILVPPPKYHVDRLIPAVNIEEKAYLSSMLVIERGIDGEEQIDHASAVSSLITNGEDAYGFPPYPLLASRLCLWKGQDLHSAERQIISRALKRCTTMRARSSSYSWWQRLPNYLGYGQLFIREPGKISAVARVSSRSYQQVAVREIGENGSSWYKGAIGAFSQGSGMLLGSMKEFKPLKIAIQHPLIAPLLVPLARSGEDARPRAVYRTLGISLVLALASLMRLIALNSVGFNSDEAVYAGQAAAIAQVPYLSDLFPVFRAHPLLYQFILAILFQWAVSDLLVRLVSVLLGVGTVFLVYRVGEAAYGPVSGLLAALFLAVMPYHVIVSRQVLLDGPLTFFTTLALFFMVRFALSSQSRWLYATGAAMGLAFLSKETGIIFLGSIFAFLALNLRIRVRLKDLALAVLCMLLVASPFPLTTLLAGGGGSQKTQQYLVWQLFRPSNHEWNFYLTNVPLLIGPLLILVTALGLLLWYKKWTWRESLFLAWIVVPVLFFQIWPTKGLQYLLPVVSPLALLAGRALSFLFVSDQPKGLDTPPNGNPNAPPRRKVFGSYGSILTVAVVISLAIPSWQRIFPSNSLTFLAGSGGVPGGREAGLWIEENIPQGATFLTIGPSMANILQFYGQQRALGLSVSPNPLHRNPSYLPVTNPDFQIRSGEIHYLVWDAYSASRSSFFSDKLLYYAYKYDGRVIHTQTVQVPTPQGAVVDKAVVVIYEVYP